MCYFNLSDNSNTVDKQISDLHSLANTIRQDVLPNWCESLWSTLWGWLPDGFIGMLLQYVILGLLAFCGLLCLCQCLPNLLIQSPVFRSKHRLQAAVLQPRTWEIEDEDEERDFDFPYVQQEHQNLLHQK